MQSELAPIQAFRVAGNRLGVQFHPEIDLKKSVTLLQVELTGSMI